MLHKLTALVLSSSLLAASAWAGDCSSLAADVQGDLQSGATVTVDVTGSLPNALTFLVVGETAGTTSIDLGPLGGLTLGLELPFVPLPVGSTDGNGDLSLSFDTPGVPVSIDPIDLLAQAVSIDVQFGGGPPSIDTCTSNVVSVTIQ